jgi:hypothetical protein
MKGIEGEEKENGGKTANERLVYPAAKFRIRHCIVNISR